MISDKGLAEQYLERRWPNGLTCPLCQTNDWFFPPEGPYLIEGSPTTFDNEDAALVIPIHVWPCVCSGCGCTITLMDEFVQSRVL